MKKFQIVIKQMIYILNKPQRILCFLVFLATCMGSFLECLGVSVIIPVVNVILNPQGIMDSSIVKSSSFLSSLSDKEMVIGIISLVIIIYLLKNLFFVFLSWLRIKFSCKIQRETSIRMMKSYMGRGYRFFLDNNYGELNRGVTGDTISVYEVLYTGFRLVSEVLTIVLLCVFMFITDWSLSLSMVIVSTVCIVLIYYVFRKRMYYAGREWRKYRVKTEQAVHQAFQGIKDILVLRKQAYFVGEYEKNQVNVQVMQCKMTVGQESPAYVIEGLCVSGLMLTVGLKVVFGVGNTEVFVANLAAFAMAAFRILPSLGKISVSLNQVLSNVPSINAVYENIREAENYALQHPEILFEDAEDTKLINRADRVTSVTSQKIENVETKFENSVEIKRVSFKYNDDMDYILKNIDLEIKKGQAIAFIGASGAGKSTLIDILLGLLIPQCGAVYKDGVSITENPEDWANTIGYVPQSIYMLDDSILANVAFGENIEDIDVNKVWEAIERAELGDFVRSLPSGIETFVGDRGVRLSGGQIQRIAIARALYHKPQILVLDEATSALDNDTEAAIMSAIDSLQGQVTLIIVAHRLTTVKNCDVIYEVGNQSIKECNKRDILP